MQHGRQREMFWYKQQLLCFKLAAGGEPLYEVV